MPTVTFFITTARSGTQWVRSTLNRIYGDLVVAEHEPLGYRYNPRRTIRNRTRLRSLLKDPAIRGHFDRIRNIIEHRHYVEVGFPAFALAPLLREEFGDRLRLVQLTRNPLNVAASTVTHHWFTEGARTDIADAILIKPGEPGAALAHYADRWSSMTGFERGLYYWYQVHAYGREQEKLSPSGRFARFRFEDLINRREARQDLTAFIGLPERDGWEESTRVRVDGHHRKTSEEIDPARIDRHLEIVELARELGYSLGSVDPQRLKQRYQTSRYMLMARDFRRGAMREVRRCLALMT